MAGFTCFTVNLITVIFCLNSSYVQITLVVYVDDIAHIVGDATESTVQAFLPRGLNKGCGNLCYFAVIEVTRNKSISVYRTEVCLGYSRGVCL